MFLDLRAFLFMSCVYLFIFVTVWSFWHTHNTNIVRNLIYLFCLFLLFFSSPSFHHLSIFFSLFKSVYLYQQRVIFGLGFCHWVLFLVPFIMVFQLNTNTLWCGITSKLAIAPHLFFFIYNRFYCHKQICFHVFPTKLFTGKRNSAFSIIGHYFIMIYVCEGIFDKGGHKQKEEKKRG